MSKIILKSVTKSFTLGHSRGEGVLARLLDFFSGKEKKLQKTVVKNISFEVKPGEVVAIIGKNGSGKSTLLRLIAGIYTIDEGSIEIGNDKYGGALYINGFNHGIKPRLTMRENMYAIAAIMGLGKTQTGSVFEEIVDFSGLREFLDTKVYQFSTGMVLRLNFSIFITCIRFKNPTVLLLDEVFGAGGDIDFRNKADQKMQELLQTGVTVLIVSHNLSDLKRHAKRAIWMEEGEVKMDGEIEAVCTAYKGQK